MYIIVRRAKICTRWLAEFISCIPSMPWRQYGTEIASTPAAAAAAAAAAYQYRYLNENNPGLVVSTIRTYPAAGWYVYSVVCFGPGQLYAIMKYIRPFSNFADFFVKK